MCWRNELIPGANKKKHADSCDLRIERPDFPIDDADVEAKGLAQQALADLQRLSGLVQKLLALPFRKSSQVLVP
jgi:hypothetical protein